MKKPLKPDERRIPDATGAKNTEKRDRISAAGRVAMARAGRANLSAYRDRCSQAGLALSDDHLPPKLKEKLSRFELELHAGLGDETTAAERALVDSARISYGVIELAFLQLSLAPGRLARSKGLSATITAHQNSLLRALKALGLKGRPKSGPTLAERLEALAEREETEQDEAKKKA
jgi:hypothetical protein